MPQQTQLQKVLGSNLTPAHPPAFKPTAESKVNIILDSTTAYYQDLSGTYLAPQIP
jgi:hypothetical protein